MGKTISILLILLLAFSCVQHQDDQPGESRNYPRPEIELKVDYAKGFDLVYAEDYALVITRSIEGNTPFADTLWLPHSADFVPPPHAKVMPLDAKSICLQSTTHIAFMDVLDVFERISGVCGLQFIEDPELKHRLTELNQVPELCSSEKLHNEQLFDINPDLFFIYPFESEETKNLDEQGITTFMIAEYLETDPIARLEWIKLFGVLFQKEEEAQAYFNSVVKDYEENIQHPNRLPTFIMNLPFGDSWHTPSSNSLIVQLIEDAGYSYYFKNEVGTENVLHPNEEVWEAGAEADFWVIIADRNEPTYTKEDLLKEDAVYGAFESVKNDQVIFCNSRFSAYFTRGPIEPNILLKDLAFARGLIVDYKPKYFHLLK